MTDARVLPSQVRAARALLGWTIVQLSSSSGVSVRTIKYFEEDGSEKPFRDATLQKIMSALEENGIEFIGTPEDGPGIRLRVPRTAAEPPKD